MQCFFKINWKERWKLERDCWCLPEPNHAEDETTEANKIFSGCRLSLLCRFLLLHSYRRTTSVCRDKDKGISFSATMRHLLHKESIIPHGDMPQYRRLFLPLNLFYTFWVLAGILGALCEENDPSFPQRVLVAAPEFVKIRWSRSCAVPRLHQRNVLGSNLSESHFHRISWKQ